MFYHLSSLGCVFPHFFISPQGCPQGARFSSFLSSPPVGSSPWQPLVETHGPRTQDFHWIYTDLCFNLSCLPIELEI